MPTFGQTPKSSQTFGEKAFTDVIYWTVDGQDLKLNLYLPTQNGEPLKSVLLLIWLDSGGAIFARECRKIQNRPESFRRDGRVVRRASRVYAWACGQIPRVRRRRKPRPIVANPSRGRRLRLGVFAARLHYSRLI
ncbi:MAG: hypothetical protein PHE53_09465 [Thermoguttaceae bacterium]|nr:hypothetical protein [Thermoguttaceae bacterium]